MYIGQHPASISLCKLIEKMHELGKGYAEATLSKESIRDRVMCESGYDVKIKMGQVGAVDLEEMLKLL